MDQSATAALVFAPPVALPLAVDFRGGRLTSDGGWRVGGRSRSRRSGCAPRWPRCCRDWRRRRGRHTLLDLLRQRIYQIVAGYEDQDDADTLRARPAAEAGLRAAAGERPRSGQPADLLAVGERAARRGTATAWRRRWARSTCAERERDGRADAHRARSGQHGRSDAWRAGRERLPRLLPAAHVPPVARLRRRAPGSSSPPSCAPARPTPGMAPWPSCKRLVRRLRARWPEVTHRTARRCRLCQAGDLRLLRGRGDRLHHRLGHQCPAGALAAPLRRRGPGAAGRGGRRQGAGCWPRRSTRPTPGPPRAASSSRPKPWPRDRTPASSSPPAPMPRRRSTPGTPPAARRRTGSRT